LSRECFYITTPIYYVNAVPHIGNAYTTILCDVLARYHRQRGEKVLFATGTDEHALKVREVAQAEGVETRAYVDRMEPLFKEQWQALEIAYDDYIRTVEPRHVRVVQEVFRRLMESGDIYLGSYEGWYCVSDETFFAPSEVTGGTCPNPECRRPLSWVKEDNYFFRLSKYQDRLLQYMESHPGWLRPDYRANEVMAFTRAGLKDQSVSRINNGWGIPVPGDEKHVVYVWFDALLNYLTVAGYLQDEEKFRTVWPPSVQMMGKDIFVRFHCTLWPAMLMALGVDLPEMLVGHGFWTVEGEKISKSRGNVVYATELVKDLSSLSGAGPELAADAVRYFLLREVPFGADGDFSRAALVSRFNSDLANDLGNLLNRTVAMAHRWCGGIVPEDARVDPGLADAARSVAGEVHSALDEIQFSKALEAIWGLVSAGNRYVEQSAPWNLHREGRTAELGSVLYNALETARVAAVMINPFMPACAARMWAQLGLAGGPGDTVWQEAVEFGRLPGGTRLAAPEPIFPRIDVSKAKKTAEAASPAPAGAAPERELVSYDEFRRLDIRIAKIVSAERIEGATKLLKLTVDAGEERPRTVVAGIAEHYRPEELAGRSIVLLANLQPAKIRGVESQGMLLAADVDGRAILLQPDAPCEVPAGSAVR